MSTPRGASRVAVKQPRFAVSLRSHCPSSLTLTVQTDHAAGAMAILKMFGHSDLYTRLLAQDGIHHVGNLLSLELNCHNSFDHLKIWFEATEEVHILRLY